MCVRARAHTQYLQVWCRRRQKVRFISTWVAGEGFNPLAFFGQTMPLQLHRWVCQWPVVGSTSGVSLLSCCGEVSAERTARIPTRVLICAQWGGIVRAIGSWQERKEKSLGREALHPDCISRDVGRHDCGGQVIRSSPDSVLCCLPPPLPPPPFR